MARLRLNNQSSARYGTITFADGSTTTGTFSVAPGFATLSGSDYYSITVEPDTANEEIVHLTAYTAGATTGTFARAQSGTTGVAHSATPWSHGPTVNDFVPGVANAANDGLVVAYSSAAASGMAPRRRVIGPASLGCPGVAETYSRLLASGVTAVIDTTGRLSGYAIPLLAGQTVTSLTFISGTTAIGTPTHYWFALYSPAVATTDFATPYSLIAQTADQTSTAWAASTALTLALQSPAPYTAVVDGLYYAAIMCTAATIPTMYGINAAGGAAALLPGDFSLSPPVVWSSSSGLTTTAPATAVPVGSRIAHRPYALAS